MVRRGARALVSPCLCGWKGGAPWGLLRHRRPWDRGVSLLQTIFTSLQKCPKLFLAQIKMSWRSLLTLQDSR